MLNLSLSSFQDDTQLINFFKNLEDDTFGLPRSLSGKESACKCRRHRRAWFNPQVSKILWRRKCNPLQDSCLGNPIDTGAWRAIVQSCSQTWLSMHLYAHDTFQNYMKHLEGWGQDMEGRVGVVTRTVICMYQTLFSVLYWEHLKHLIPQQPLSGCFYNPHFTDAKTEAIWKPSNLPRLYN